MKNSMLQNIICRFDYFVKDVDFGQMPERESEEYRNLILKTANDAIFSHGRYSEKSEMTLELFDDDEVREAVCDLNQINRLSDDERKRLRFYIDLKDVCYPLFKGLRVDWTSWPWNMKDASSSLDNDELFDFLTECHWPMLSAAIVYDLVQLIWQDEEFYTSVARQEASDIYEHDIKSKWDYCTKSPDGIKELSAKVNKAANDLWLIENHLHVGRQLGFDYTAQSVYDAMDTFIDTTYRHKQVDFARELGAWINENMTMGERHPEQEKVEAFLAKMNELMERYKVSSPNKSYTWNIITLDLLGMAVFSEEEEEDDFEWDDDVNQ